MNKYAAKRQNMNSVVNSPRYYFNRKYSVLSKEINDNMLRKAKSKCSFNETNKHSIKTFRYFPQRSTITGDLVSKPKSDFKPTDIYFYPKLSECHLVNSKQWRASKKSFKIYRVKLQ